MYALISLGNQQFKVQNEEIFLSQKTSHKVGDTFQTPVLITVQDNKVNIGTPILNTSKATLKVVEDVKGQKIHGYKYKKRKNYHRRWGHRQQLQKIQVVNIQ